MTKEIKTYSKNTLIVGNAIGIFFLLVRRMFD